MPTERGRILKMEKEKCNIGMNDYLNQSLELLTQRGVRLFTEVDWLALANAVET